MVWLIAKRSYDIVSTKSSDRAPPRIAAPIASRRHARALECPDDRDSAHVPRRQGAVCAARQDAELDQPIDVIDVDAGARSRLGTGVRPLDARLAPPRRPESYLDPSDRFVDPRRRLRSIGPQRLGSRRTDQLRSRRALPGALSPTGAPHRGGASRRFERLAALSAVPLDRRRPLDDLVTPGALEQCYLQPFA